LYNKYGADSSRDPFSGIWSRTLRIKITGRDGIEKLDLRIPVSVHSPTKENQNEENDFFLFRPNFFHLSKFINVVNQSQTIICMTFKLDMMKINFFLMIERLLLTEIFTLGDYELNLIYCMVMMNMLFIFRLCVCSKFGMNKISC
jgi:hypothetical protein